MQAVKTLFAVIIFAMACLASCSQESDETSSGSGSSSGTRKTEFTNILLVDTDKLISLSYDISSEGESYNYCISWAMIESACNGCTVTYTCATQTMAILVFNELDPLEQAIAKRNGNIITMDLSTLYIGKSRADILEEAKATEAMIKSQGQ